jgi:hypothetical protein
MKRNSIPIFLPLVLLTIGVLAGCKCDPGTEGPANDDFMNAISISAGAPMEITNNCASVEEGEHVQWKNGEHGASVWLVWTAPDNVTDPIPVLLDVSESDFNGELTLHTGETLDTVEKQLWIKFNAGAGGESVWDEEYRRFLAEPGMKYYIQVSGYKKLAGYEMGSVVVDLSIIEKKPAEAAIQGSWTGTRDVTMQTYFLKQQDREKVLNAFGKLKHLQFSYKAASRVDVKIDQNLVERDETVDYEITNKITAEVLTGSWIFKEKGIIVYGSTAAGIISTYFFVQQDYMPGYNDAWNTYVVPWGSEYYFQTNAQGLRIGMDLEQDGTIEGSTQLIPDQP